MKKIAAVAAGVVIVAGAFTGGMLVSGQDEGDDDVATTSTQETRDEKCYRLTETEVYDEEWSTACEGVEPLWRDAGADDSVEDVGNPYGEDYDDDYLQDEPTVTDDGTDAIVEEMRRQEQQRRADESMRRMQEDLYAWSDKYGG